MYKISLLQSVSIEASTDGRDLEIDGDKSRLTQVISNIVGNAVKFTTKGKIHISVKSSIERNVVEITVSDTGGGIPQDIYPNLFGKFVTKNVNGANKHGTGLGLFISRAIVEAHGGKISANNNGSGGATFAVLLPIEHGRKVYEN